MNQSKENYLILLDEQKAKKCQIAEEDRKNKEIAMAKTISGTDASLTDNKSDKQQ